MVNRIKQLKYRKPEKECERKTFCESSLFQKNQSNEQSTWRNALSLKNKKVQGTFGETFTKPCLRCLLICFAREMKDFYQSSLENEVDFRDIMNVSQNILAKS